MVPAILDTEEWKSVMHTANPCYNPVLGDTFQEKYIPAEAALVQISRWSYFKTPII